MKIQRVGKNDKFGYRWIITSGRGRNFKNLGTFETEEAAVKQLLTLKPAKTQFKPE